MKVTDILITILHVLLSPIYIAIFFIFMSIWLIITVTGIGPLLQLYYRRKDKNLLNIHHLLASHSDMRVLTVPGTINSATNGASYRLVLRLSRPLTKPKAYVCMPNGLGATMVILAKLQDVLTERGYAVLTFDRLGVGFTDDNPTGKSPSAEDVVRECDFVMKSIEGSEGVADIKWILVGPSMGSIVAQCYIAAYPEKVIGFLNMDGVAYPFHNKRRLFNFAAKIYHIYPMIIWTGILRPFIGMAVKKSPKMFANDTFSLTVPTAQLNQARFFSNIALEMTTMMDCCEFAARAWGPLNITSLDADSYAILVAAPPNESVEVDEVSDERKVVHYRGKSERGENWSCEDDMNKLLATMNTMLASASSSASSSLNSSLNSDKVGDLLIKQSALSYGSMSSASLLPVSIGSQVRLSQRWQELVVGVMSARDHEFGSTLANAFYRPEMKDLAAAEHAVHAIWAKKGFRTAYPAINHGSIFGKTMEIVDHVERIHNTIQAS